MKRNPESLNNLSPSEINQEPKMRHVSKKMALIAIGLTLGSSLFFGGDNHNLSFNHDSLNINSSNYVLDSHVSSSSSSSESSNVESKVETTKLKGINGEYFTDQPTWCRTYSDRSNGALDSSEWHTFTGPAPANHEAEYYSNSIKNLRIDNGALVLEACNESSGDKKYTSARIDTEGIQNFRYGKFNIIAEVPIGIGTWPAVWLYPTNNIYASQNHNLKDNTYIDGEMDIIESIGTEPHRIYQIAHSMKNPDSGTYYSTIDLSDSNTNFHNYGLEWTPDNLTFSVDDKVVYSVNKKASYSFEQWPYDQDYYLIANLALGGNWGGQDKNFSDGIDQSTLPADLKIKSITYRPYVGTD